MNEITILFRDDPDHEGFNKQILSFLEDKHRSLNQNGYIIRPVIVDSDNIDKYVKLGVQSLPALLTSNDNQENGVNDIIAFLSIKTSDPKDKQKNSIVKNKFQNLIQEMANVSLEDLKREETEDVSSKKSLHSDALTQEDIMKGNQKFDYINKKQSVPSRKKTSQNAPSKDMYQEQNTKFDNMDKDEIHIMQRYLDSINTDDEEEQYSPDYM